MLEQKHNWRILIVIVFFVSFVMVGSKAVKTLASSQPDWTETNVSGWAWIGNAQDAIPHIGWISTNCYNYFDGFGVVSQCSGSSDYGLKIDPITGDISGYMWGAVQDDSGATTGIGWIDFSPPPFVMSTLPSSLTYPARVEPSGSPYAGQMSGWIKIDSLAEIGKKLGYSDWGWVLLGPEPGADHFPVDPNGWGVYIDFNTGKVSGYAWSGGSVTGDTFPPEYEQVSTGLGWIDFGDSVRDPNYPIATYQDEALHGWAWIGNADSVLPPYSANIGWIALNCENAGQNGEDICGSTGDFKVTVDPTSGEVGGYGWSGWSDPNQIIEELGSCQENSSACSPIGWIDFDPLLYPDWPNFSAKFFQEDPPPFFDPHNPDSSDPLYDYEAGDVAGWARIVTLKKAGENTDKQDWGWVKLHPTNNENDSHPADYGITINFNSGTLDGYAWSSGGTVAVDSYDRNVGLGWISFEKTIPGLPPTYVAPFLETQQGDIFSTEGVGTDTTFNPPGPPLASEQFYNATFLIQSGGTIEHFTSESAETVPKYLQPGYNSQLEPPFPTNRYTNVMGNLDLGQYGLTYYEDPVDKLNKFGNVVEDYLGDQISSDLWKDGLLQLNGKVYHFLGDLTIDEDLIIENGDVVENPVASGTIVIDGDLNIQSNITYDPYPLPSGGKLEYIPSIAWIVKGEVTVSSSVTNADGVFIVVGQDEFDPIGELDPNTGEFSTGEGQKSLAVSGLIIAHELILQRSGIGTLEKIEPAEKVFYDGRVIVNTPPGLSDFAAALPVIREVAPVEVTP